MDTDKHARNTDVPRGLEADLRLLDAEVRFDKGSLALYASDASNYRHVPVGVVIPRTKEAVIGAVNACRRHGVPVISRGGGTALAGQSVNAAVMIDFSKYLNRVLEVNAEEKWARVEPGCILDDLRDRTQERHRLTYGPDPATHTHCTFGGMIGNNSCGIHSVMSGRTADNVLELEVLTYDGQILRVGATNDEELERVVAGGGRRGEIYAGLRALRDRYAGEIRRRYPKIPRRVSGYNLDDLLPENGFNVARALVGTEGTCVVVLEAKVRLVHWPAKRALVVLGYKDLNEAADRVPEVMKFKPVGLEALDELLVEFMKKKKLHTSYIHLLPEGKAWLLAEFGGDTQAEADAQAGAAMAALKALENPPGMVLYDDKEAEREVWKLRESGLGATANVPGLPLSWPGWEDSAVPPENLGPYVREFRQLLDKHGLQASLYGHFGQGCLHCRITFDLFTHDGVRNYVSFIEEAADLVVKYGGSLSGEHGDGQSRAMLLPKMYGEDLVAAFREFKRLWDPGWKMNPGKVVDPRRADEDLRLGPAYRPWEPKTHFAFKEDQGSFSRAALRCVGVGKCRRTHDAFMCPSFLVTREEKDTTRGRAHLLWEMVEGDILKDGWRSKEVLESLDLCLACKACKKECPVNVDMASYKAEFLSHYYENRPRPREAYAMGFIEAWALIGSGMPRTANFAARTPGLSRLLKRAAGISPRRPLPRFAHRTFSSWFAARGGSQTRVKKVVLIPDVFNDCFHPDTLIAAVDVLERYGYQVLLPRARVPETRAVIHYGFLEKAKRDLRRTLDILHPQLSESLPVVLCEPSSVAVYRDELASLLPDDQDAKRLNGTSWLLSEFVMNERLPLPRLSGKAIFHGHCHQKAVLQVEAARKLLEKMGLEYQEPQEGCCGMAGSFGFEERHYEVSMKIGELGLLPAVRRARDDVYVVADGFSCRTQVLDGTGRLPMHSAELLRHALELESRSRAMDLGQAVPAGAGRQEER